MNHASHTTTYETTGARIAAVRCHRSQPQTPNRPTRGTHRSLAAAGPLAAALIACLTFAGESHGQFAGFAPPQPYAVGNTANHVAVADLNGDGNPDLVVVNAQDGTVSVLLGNGTGAFGAQQTYPTGGPSSRVTIADLNGDGVPDLAVAGGGGVAVLLGNGDGSFGPPEVFGVGFSGAHSVAVGDFNGNGHLDLAAASGGSPHEIAVLLGNGDGTFVLVQNVDAGGSSPRWIVAADLNLDGNPDLALRAGDGVSVLLGLGNGTFAPPQVFPVEGSEQIAIADLNGNGIPDIAAARTAFNIGGVFVLLGNGDGTFAPALFFGGEMPPTFRIAIADLDGDGAADVLLTSSAQMLFVMPGNGDGTFGAPYAFPTAGSTPWGLATGDFNGNGAPDAVVANGFENNVWVYINHTDVLPPLAFDLLSPPDGAADLALPETVMTWPGANAALQWSVASSFATTYTLTIALDPGLRSIVLEESSLTATHFNIPAGVLEPGTTYHWGVVAESQGGQTPSTPDSFSFSTALSASSECPADLTGDGAVGVADLLMLLSAWGACP